ncbi:ABC transporter substrate-binding protein [Bifidobacterium sp.]|uniref:ABC transporter substrate-binding protein n=1 Tax=Bifidobacterium sp. TaxID=41200 RepID=UPI0039E9CD59
MKSHTRQQTFARLAKHAASFAAALISATMVISLGACSGGISDSIAPSGGAADKAVTWSQAARGGTLHIYTWADYVTPEVQKAYEKATGTKLTIDTFDSNEALEAKLQSSGGAGYDIVMPSDYMVKQLITDGLLQKVDIASLPNAKNIKTSLRKPYYDPKDQYSIPYIIGYTGFVYDSTVLSSAQAPKTWKQFFNPPAAAGKVQILNDQVEIVNAALRAVGAEQCSTRNTDYQKADTLLASFKSKVGVMSSDGVADRLASGEEKLGMSWSFDAYQAMESNANLRFVYPTDGTSMYVDTAAIVRGSQHVGQALTFLNYMLNVKNKQAVEESGGSGSVLTGGDALLPEAMRKINAVVPTDAESKTLVLEQQCSNTVNDYYTKLYENFTQQ